MDDADRLKLIHGPYVAPPVKRGDVLTCEKRDGDVKVLGWSDGPIPWPYWRCNPRPSLILCGDLVDAVRVESEQAVAHHWAVTLRTVQSWRRALGVGRTTEGTSRLHREYVPDKITDDVRRKAMLAAASPEASARKSAARRGLPLHPRFRAAAAAAARRPKSEAARLAMSLAARARVHPLDWTPEEEDLLGTASDAEIAERLGRTATAVRARRLKLGRRLPRKDQS